MNKFTQEFKEHVYRGIYKCHREEVERVLNSFEGEVLEREKYLIEKVNEKYPSGWYCEAFEEVQQDLKDLTKDNSWDYPFVGYNRNRFTDGGYDGDFFGEVFEGCKKITEGEYLTITRPGEIKEEAPEQPGKYEGFTFSLKLYPEGGIFSLKSVGDAYDVYTEINERLSKKPLNEKDVEVFITKGLWVAVDKKESNQIQQELPSTDDIKVLNTRIHNTYVLIEDLLKRVVNLENTYDTIDSNLEKIEEILAPKKLDLDNLVGVKFVTNDKDELYTVINKDSVNYKIGWGKTHTFMDHESVHENFKSGAYKIIP